jgi:uncharacterized protein YlxW (UPF0749 family)
MEMEQMKTHLLAEMNAMQEKMDSYQKEMKTNQKRMEAKIETNNKKVCSPVENI